MLVDIELDSALRSLVEPHVKLKDQVIPTLQPALPTNCYRSEYAWQHSYERSLMKRARDWIGGQRDELIGASGLLSETLSNAYVHGNQRDPCRPITVELFVGQRGYLLRVAQSGLGFDYREVVGRYRRRAHYYNIGGNGIRKLDTNQYFCAFFGDDGRAVHLWYRSLP